MPEKEYLTKEKYEEFKKELSFLKTVKRKEIAESLEYARSLGDLSENAEYHEARDAQANIEDRINRLEYIIKNASIISSHKSDQIEVGSVITVLKDKEKEPKVYTIVGSEETDSLAGKISIKSPFGQSAMGKKKGETFSFKTPNGIINYKIVDIK